MDNKGHAKDIVSTQRSVKTSQLHDLVLEKNIFSNVFDKDIRRAYLYKKAERIGKALHLIMPAFKDSRALTDRAEQISLGLTDASTHTGGQAKEALSRELLSLSSLVAMARAGGRLSPMNADIILREIEDFLQELSSYEDPRVVLSEVPTLAVLSRTVSRTKESDSIKDSKEQINRVLEKEIMSHIPLQGHTKSTSMGPKKNERREQILKLLEEKGSVYIKDLSLLIRDVSEKTVQRELQALVQEGRVTREGERRWTRYSPVKDTPR